MTNNSEDPLVKLKQLQDWLANNRVAKTERKSAPSTNKLWSTAISPEAQAELRDFQSWMQEMQTDGAPPKMVHWSERILRS